MNRRAQSLLVAVTALLLAISAAAETSPGIMDRPLDGSSVEAFEEGLAQVDAEATAQQASHLRQAVNYLLVFDLAVKKDKATLYRKLDGKTPNQILEIVKR